MALLILYILIALGFSFLCSLLEAGLLSLQRSFIAVLVDQGRPAGSRLLELTADIDRPLAAILTLNTFAHTLGAAGVGAQAAVIWGEAWVGLVSFVVTVLILVLSEVVPKTLGAVHAERLAGRAGDLRRRAVVALHGPNPVVQSVLEVADASVRIAHVPAIEQHTPLISHVVAIGVLHVPGCCS